MGKPSRVDPSRHVADSQASSQDARIRVAVETTPLGRISQIRCTLQCILPKYFPRPRMPRLLHKKLSIADTKHTFQYLRLCSVGFDFEMRSNLKETFGDKN